MSRLDLDERLRRVFRRSFAVDRLDDTVSMGNVKGWDSLGHVGLMLALQHEFGIRIPPARALTLVNVEQIRAFLNENGAA
jgi:acyl carrier protein